MERRKKQSFRVCNLIVLSIVLYISRNRILFGEFIMLLGLLTVYALVILLIELM